MRVQVREQLAVLQGASGELRACSDFMILLRAVLTLGNHLNEGTMRGAASGRTSCLALADIIPEHTLMLQRHAHNPTQRTVAEVVLSCHAHAGQQHERGHCVKMLPQVHSGALALQGLQRHCHWSARDGVITGMCSLHPRRVSRILDPLGERCLTAVIVPVRYMTNLTAGCALAGFKLDTLLKLADVKGTDRKTSLLHFVLEQLLKEQNASVGTLSAQLKSIRPAANLQVCAAAALPSHRTPPELRPASETECKGSHQCRS